MVEKKRKTELDIEGVAAPKVEAPPPPKPEPKPAPPPEIMDEPSEEASPAEQKKKIIIIAVIASLAVLVVVLLMVKSHYAAKAKEAQKEEKVVKPPPPPPVKPPKPVQVYNYAMEPFLFTYDNKGKEGFIRLGLAFEMSNEDAVEEAKGNTPLLRRSVLFFINTKDKKDLLKDETRKPILDEIKANIDKSLQSGRVNAVYITEFTAY